MFQHLTKIVLIPVIKRWAGLMVLGFWGCFIPYGKGCALNLGVQGSVYEIGEADALVWIKERLMTMEKSGELKRLQEKLTQSALSSIERPHPVKGLKPTKTSRVFERDLTITLLHDIKDAKGNLIYKSGTKLNPLSQVFTKKRLIFLDGDDEKQLNWALTQYKKSMGLTKLVLINGAPLSLMRQYEIPFYFDQQGRLSAYFKLEQIPAMVYQKDDKLVISEVKL